MFLISDSFHIHVEMLQEVLIIAPASHECSLFILRLTIAKLH